MEGLRRFAGVDADGLGRGEQEIGQEEVLAQGHDSGVEHDVPKHAGARHQGVDALGAQAFKVVAPGVGFQVEREHAAGLCELLRAQEIFNDGVTVLLNLRDVMAGVEDHERRS